MVKHSLTWLTQYGINIAAKRDDDYMCFFYRIEPPLFATKKNLTIFHCEKYINCLEHIQDCWQKKDFCYDEDTIVDDLVLLVGDLEEYGISKCPKFLILI